MSFREGRILLLVALLAAIGLFMVVRLYLLAPLAVWKKNPTRITRSRAITPATASEEVKAAVQELAAAVQPLGFDLREVSELNDGMAVALHASDPATHTHLLDYHMAEYRWQVFRTELQDGREVVTANAPLPSVFSRPKGLHACGLPPGTDLLTLHRAHRAHVELKARGAAPIPGQSTGYVEHHERRGMEAQCELGVYRRVGEEYRPTLRGAFLTTWRLLPPLKQLRAARNARVVRAILPPG